MSVTNNINSDSFKIQLAIFTLLTDKTVLDTINCQLFFTFN